MLELSAQHQPVTDLLQKQLEEVAIIFERQLASELSAVNSLCSYIERYRGKMLRPTLVLLRDGREIARLRPRRLVG